MIRFSLILCLLSPLTIFAQDDGMPNPTWQDLEEKQPHILRAATWNVGGKNENKLRSPHPFKRVQKGNNADLPLFLMKHYNIDIFCINDVHRTKIRTAVGDRFLPTKRTIFFEAPRIEGHIGKQVMAGGFIHQLQVNQRKYNLGFAPIVFNTKTVSCATPIPNSVSFGGNPKRRINLAACEHLNTKKKFFFGCTMATKKTAQLKRDLIGMSNIVITPPFAPFASSFILGADFNSWPRKHLFPFNPIAKNSLGWRELGIYSIPGLEHSAGVNEGGTFTVIKKTQNNTVRPHSIADDLIHSPDFTPRLRSKSVIPVQTFPLNPSGNAFETRPDTEWKEMLKFSDHLPVQADYEMN